MKKVILLFPDTVAMAEFILSQRIPRTQCNTRDKTLTAQMTDQQIETARRQYGASIKAAYKL